MTENGDREFFNVQRLIMTRTPKRQKPYLQRSEQNTYSGYADDVDIFVTSLVNEEIKFGIGINRKGRSHYTQSQSKNLHSASKQYTVIYKPLERTLTLVNLNLNDFVSLVSGIAMIHFITRQSRKG